MARSQQQMSPLLSELEPRRVCVIKPSALGDIIQTLPVLTMLRHRWPRAHLSWIAKASLAGILQGHPDLDEVIQFDRCRGLKNITSFVSLAHYLTRRQFDLAIDMQGLLRSGLMTIATRAPRRVGFSSAREGAALMYTDTVHVPTQEMAALDRYQRMAAALGCPGTPPPARIGISDADRQWARTQLAGLPRPILAIHPGAQWQTKRWPPEHFTQLARQAQAAFGAGVVLVGGPDDCPLTRRIAAEMAGSCIDLAGQTKLLQLAAIVEAADVFLSGDSGPMHLAAALETPVVSLFTCTSPLRAGPRDQLHRVVATQVACAASYRRRCSSMACMAELTPERVWPVLSATLQLANENPRRQAS